MANVEEASKYLRCCECRKLMSKKQLLKIGMCPACGSGRARGANPVLFERFLILIRIIR